MTTTGTFTWCEGCPMPDDLESDWQAGHCNPVWRLCPTHKAEADNICRHGDYAPEDY